MLRRFLQLSPSERRLLAESALLVLCIRVALWALPYNTVKIRLRRWFKPALRHHPSSSIVRAISAVSQYVPKASCLTQALAAETLLHRHGYPAVIHIGVARSNAKTLEAHAWVESEGRIILGGPEVAGFTPLKGVVQR